MSETGKRAIVFGTIFILITMSMIPIYASDTTKNQSPQKVQSEQQYVLGYITVSCDWFFVKGHVPFKAVITFSNQTEFHFPEINGIIQMNFTVICKQRLEDHLIFPRWVKYYAEVWEAGSPDYTWDYWSHYYRCRSLLWKYHNITLDKTNWIFPVHTNGSNATIRVILAVSGLPVPILPTSSANETITVVPGSDP
jgi:hypothetical protein